MRCPSKFNLAIVMPIAESPGEEVYTGTSGAAGGGQEGNVFEAVGLFPVPPRICPAGDESRPCPSPPELGLLENILEDDVGSQEASL